MQSPAELGILRGCLSAAERGPLPNAGSWGAEVPSGEGTPETHAVGQNKKSQRGPGPGWQRGPGQGWQWVRRVCWRGPGAARVLCKPLSPATWGRGLVLGVHKEPGRSQGESPAAFLIAVWLPRAPRSSSLE